MPRSIVINGVKLERRGEVGVRLIANDKSICIDPGRVIEDCDMILCTHDHSRHCDRDLVLRYTKETIAPFMTTRSTQPFTEITLGEIVVKPIPAYNREEAIPSTHADRIHRKGCCFGYIVGVSDALTIYYTGDTSLVDEILRVDEKIDVLIPCLGEYTTLTPEEAFELAKSIRPWIILLTHYSDLYLAIKYRDMVYPYANVVLMR